MLEVLGHRVLVRPDPVEEVSKGGIVMVATETAKKLEQNAQIWGTVVQVGPTAYKNEGLGNFPWVSIGDRVAYAKYGGKFIVDEETKEQFVILNDEDIVCRVK